MSIAAGLFQSTGPFIISFLLSAVIGGVGMYMVYRLTASYRARKTKAAISHSRCIDRIEALLKQSSDLTQAHLELINARVKLEERRYQASLLVDGVGLHFLIGFGQTCLWLLFLVSYVALSIAFHVEIGDVKVVFLAMLIVPATLLGIAMYGAFFGPGALEQIDTLVALADSQLASVGIIIPARLELCRAESDAAQDAIAVVVK
ncbi:hypothetical protein PLCT2_00722 [Planctomycetaceae bacterium]|nr:hypothetical protein PLCT2_00722 [Planctomycetaceae bacterium]